MRHRHLAPALALAGAAAVIAAGPASATPTYPPTTPSPTATTVAPEVLSTEESVQPQAEREAETKVLGVKLPRTGSELAVVGAVGATLLVAGAGAVVTSRRRNGLQR